MSERRYLEAGGFSPRPTHALIRLRAYLSRRYALTLFVGIFVVPTLWAMLFYGVIASDRYVSEAQFIVRGVNSQQVGGLSVLLRTFGIARSNDDAFAIQSYMESRDAVRDLQQTIDFHDIYARPDADYLTRFGTLLSGGTTEDLYKHYRRRVILQEDLETGITTLRVSAYRAEDAERIASQLMALSEKRVNEMNARARADTLRFAQETLAEAGENVVKSQLELTKFRNAELLINPEQTASGNFEVIAALTQELVQEQVRRQQMESSSPSNPNLPASRGRISSLEKQIAIEKSKLTGSEEAISTKLGKYEELLLRRTLADKAYEAASHSIEQARQEAARKQIYLEAVVRPGLPDKSLEPRRAKMVLSVFVLSLATFVMAYLLVSGSRDHLNIE